MDVSPSSAALQRKALRRRAVLRSAAPRKGPHTELGTPHLTSKLLAFWWVVPTNSLRSVARSNASLRHVTHRGAKALPPSGGQTSHLKASGFLVGCTHQRRDVSLRNTTPRIAPLRPGPPQRGGTPPTRNF